MDDIIVIAGINAIADTSGNPGMKDTTDITMSLK